MTLDEQIEKLQVSIDGAIGLIERYDTAAKAVIEACRDDELHGLYHAVQLLRTVYERRQV